jgi:cytidine deaminase
LVYERNEDLLIHAGANIDPQYRGQFADPKYRNCAERQAAISAWNSDQLTKQNLQIMFLYRKKNSSHNYGAEKLLPCRDCNEQYIEALIKNHGKLILIIDDNHPRTFLKEGSSKQLIDSVSINGLLICYKIFDHKEIAFLKTEKDLAPRICHS